MKNVNFLDVIELSHIETAAAINKTIHYLRLQRTSPAQATLVEMLCNYLEVEHKKLLNSALGSMYNHHKLFLQQNDNTSEG